MAIYDYRGLNAVGKNIKGIIDAPSVEIAREKLKSRGLYLQEISEVSRRRKGLFRSISFSHRRNTASIITRQISFMLSAQLPVINALDGVIDQTDDEDIKKWLSTPT